MPRGDDPLYDPNAPPGAAPAAPGASPPPTISPSPATPPQSAGPGRGRGSDPLYIPETRSAASPSSPSASGGPPPQPAGQNDLGTTAVWNKPANVSWGDYMLAHLATPFKQAYQNFDISDPQAQATGRVAANTFGVGDRALAMLPGADDLATQRAKTAAAESYLGPSGTFVANALGYAPLGALGLGARIGGALGSTAVGGGVLGAMGEGAIAGGAGAMGHDENPIIGAAEGAAGGVLGGALTRGLSGPFSSAVAKQRADITAAAQGARDDAYSALTEPKYHSSELLPELDQMKADLYRADTDNALPQAAPRAMKVYNSLVSQTQDAQSQMQSAGAIQDAIKKFKDIQGGPPGMEVDVATHFRDGLEGLIGTADSNAGPGTVGSLMPVTNHTPVEVQGMLTAASDAQKAYKNAQFLQQSGQNLKAFGQSPSGEAEAIAQKYYPSQAQPYAINPNDPAAAQYSALANINKAAGGGGMTPYGVVHATRPLVEAGGAALGGALGGGVGAVAGDALAGAVDYGLVKPLASKGLGWMASKGTQKAINEAYPALVPGQTVAPPSPDFAKALRALIYGNLAGRL